MASRIIGFGNLLRCIDEVGKRKAVFLFETNHVVKRVFRILDRIVGHDRGAATFPLGTSAAIVKKAPLLLVDLETEEGITGHSYVFCYRSSVPRAIDALLRDAVSLVTGEQAVPLQIAARLSRRFAPAYNSSGLGLMSPEAAADEAEKLLVGGFREQPWFFSPIIT